MFLLYNLLSNSRQFVYQSSGTMEHLKQNAFIYCSSPCNFRKFDFLPLENHFSRSQIMKRIYKSSAGISSEKCILLKNSTN